MNLPKAIDISTWQDSSSTPQHIDFTKPKQYDIKLIINRATMGLGIDDDFLYNWEQEKLNNYYRTAYGFWDYRLGVSTTKNQALSFVRDINKAKDIAGLPEFPVLWMDFEQPLSTWPALPSRLECLSSIDTYMKTVEDALGIECGLYTSSRHIKYNLSVFSGTTCVTPIPPWLKAKKLWVAMWPDSKYFLSGETIEEYIDRVNFRPNIYGQWDSWFIWQYGPDLRGKQMGMESAEVDADYINLSESDLEKFINKDNGDIQNMYETNAKTLYVSSDHKVANWDALASQVDGVVFIRAAYVPVWQWTNGVQSGKYIVFANIKNDDDYLREDPDYKTNFAEAKKRGLKVIAVAEFNPIYDRDSNFDGHYQIDQLKKILTFVGDYRADAYSVQVLQFQWVESNMVKTMPANNFAKAIRIYLEQIYAKFGKTVFVWSQTNPLKANFVVNNERYDYNKEFTIMFDLKNAGEPSIPVAFTYLPASWKTATGMNSMVNTLAEAVAKFPSLTSSDVDMNMKIGSYQGWMAKSGNGKFNHGFWGMFGPKSPVMLNSAYMEPIIFDCDKAELFKWMLWTESVPPDDDGNPGDDDDGDIDLTEVNTKLDKVLANQALILKGIEDLKSVFSKFSGTNSFKSFLSGVFK